MPGLPSAAKQQVSGREPSFGHPHPQVELLERLPLPVADRDEPDEQNQRRPVLPGLWMPTIALAAPGPRVTIATPGRRRWLRLARQDGQHPHDMVAELGQVVLEEVSGRLVGALAVAGEDLGGEADVGLGRGHLAGVAEAQHRAQALLGDGGADLADGCADHAGRDVVEGVLAPRP